MHDPRSFARKTLRNTNVAVRALMVGLLVMLVPAGAILAVAQQAASQTGGKKGITLQVTPSSLKVDQGESVSYAVAVISTGGFSGKVSLSVTGLPAKSAAVFSPQPVTVAAGNTATVTMRVTTATDTPAGNFALTVNGQSGTIQAVSAAAQLSVEAVHHEFSLSGNVSGLLAPGTTRPLDLQITNPNNKSVALTSLSVSVTGVVRTAAALAAGLSCGKQDYAVIQYSGPYPFTVPAGTSSLSGLGVPSAKWPQIRMLDTPVLQDGCKGATLQLAYSASGQGS